MTLQNFANLLIINTVVALSLKIQNKILLLLKIEFIFVSFHELGILLIQSISITVLFGITMQLHCLNN
jgi:hypothetical protein